MLWVFRIALGVHAPPGLAVFLSLRGGPGKGWNVRAGWMANTGQDEVGQHCAGFWVGAFAGIPISPFISILALIPGFDLACLALL